MRPFEVTIPNTSVNLGPAGKTDLTFSVSNVSGRASRANFVLLPDDPKTASWLTLKVPPSYDFTKEGATTQVGVTIASPPGAAAGTYTFKLRALSSERPDDDFTDGPTVAFTLGPARATTAFPWWAIIVAVLVVALGGGVAAYLHLRPSASGPAGRIVYLANRAGNVLGFPVGSTGNVPPTINISGAATGLRNPVGFAIDASGRFVVANDSGVSVSIFAASANGNVAPVANLGGPTANLGPTEGLAFDRAGNLYVSVYTGQGRGPSVAIFAAGATGDVAPVHVIVGPSTQFLSPRGITVDDSGKLYVANVRNVLIFAAGADGNTAPAATLGGPATGIGNVSYVAVDKSGKIYVPEYGGATIRIFAPGATGDVAPIAVIAGTRTTLAGIGSIGLDSAGYLYVLNGTSNNTMLVFSPGASGNVAPVTTVSGPTTLIDDAFYPTVF
jgi:hypothetical protein